MGKVSLSTIAKNSHDILDDSYLNSNLSKDDESFDLDMYYHKTCYQKFCDEERSVGNKRKKTVRTLKTFVAEWKWK